MAAVVECGCGRVCSWQSEAVAEWHVAIDVTMRFAF